MIGSDSAAVRTLVEGWMRETEDPEIEWPVTGLLSPRLDHNVMWPVYAAVYHAARTAGADRILLLGNNHYGIGDGVVLTRVGVQSPLGRLEADTAVVDALVDQLGDRAIVDELDHLADHGIEMQAPWITVALGNIPVVGALLPDPLQPPIDDDETARVTPERFMDVARNVLNDAPGKTLVIATGDLSHVGPRFGEPRPVDEARQTDVEQHDREFIGTMMTGDLEAIDDAVKWHQNPTRWSCLGAVRAMIGIVQPSDMELIDYRQQRTDEQGSAMITAAGFAAGGG
jgi:AmmeMemoRadiSam system protein B